MSPRPWGERDEFQNEVRVLEIQGEDGSLIIESISECLSIAFTPRGGHSVDLTQPQHINTMLYEAEVFADLVENTQVEHAGLPLSLLTSRIQTDIRRQTGVIFPADTQPPAVS